MNNNFQFSISMSIKTTVFFFYNCPALDLIQSDRTKSTSPFRLHVPRTNHTFEAPSSKGSLFGFVVCVCLLLVTGLSKFSGKKFKHFKRMPFLFIYFTNSCHVPFQDYVLNPMYPYFPDAIMFIFT